MRFFYSSCDPHGDAQATIHLRCYISGYTPGKMKVTWLVDGQEDRNLFSYTAPDQLEGKLASTYSEVNITQGQWASQITYTCQVSYYGFIYEKHALRCTAESEPRGVSAYLSPPTPLDLYVHKSPKLTCLVVDLASSENVNQAPLLPRGSLRGHQRFIHPEGTGPGHSLASKKKHPL